MVKFSYLILYIIIATGCNNTMKRLAEQYRGNINDHSSLCDDDLAFKLIDTSAVYMITHIDSKTYMINSKLDTIDLVQVNRGIKFYKDGRVAMYQDINFDDVQSFNPQNATKGFYCFKDGEYKIGFLFSHIQSGKFFSNSNLEIRGDSIISYKIPSPQGGGYYTTYVKQKIPSKFLIYNPLW